MRQRVPNLLTGPGAREDAGFLAAIDVPEKTESRYEREAFWQEKLPVIPNRADADVWVGRYDAAYVAYAQKDETTEHGWRVVVGENYIHDNIAPRLLERIGVQIEAVPEPDIDTSAKALENV